VGEAAGFAADETAGCTADGAPAFSAGASLRTEVPFGSWFCAGEATGGAGRGFVGADWVRSGLGEISTSSPINENPARRINFGSTPSHNLLDAPATQTAPICQGAHQPNPGLEMAIQEEAKLRPV